MKDILIKYMNEYTSLSEKEQVEILNSIHIKEFKKGSTLVRQGESSNKCFFVLKGCIRQYYIDESGKEITSNFFTEEQAIAPFNQYKPDHISGTSLVCIEDSVMVVGDLESEKEMYHKHKQLESMTRMMMEMNLGKMQQEFTEFINATPEERYQSILEKRPHLVDRVPQHQLASYLGITPESLSRIKKRINKA